MNILSLDLNLLRVFHVLAQERSVTRTAERLDLSQPAVSNALRRLRESFGDPLFVRGKGGMAPTPRGADLVEPVADALHKIETALVGGSQVDPSQIVEPLVITSADEEIVLHGADILRALDLAGCTAPLQFLPLDKAYRADELWRNRQALTLTTILFAPNGLKQRKAYDDHLLCLLRSDHPAAEHLDLAAYLAARHILVAPLGGDPQGYLDDWLREQGHARQIQLVSHTFGSVPMLVRKTGLIATVPSRLAVLHQDDPTLTSLPLPIAAPPFGVHIFWSERYDKDPVNKWFRDLVHSAMLAEPEP